MLPAGSGIFCAVPSMQCHHLAWIDKCVHYWGLTKRGKRIVSQLIQENKKSLQLQAYLTLLYFQFYFTLNILQIEGFFFNFLFIYLFER